MKKLITILTLFAGLSAWAVIPEKHPTDQFQIGKSSTSNKKQLLFDWGLGLSSNPFVGVDSSYNLNYNFNEFLMGDGANSTQKSFVANIGNGGTNPSIVWNHSLNQWQFSNNGTAFQSIGSGGGGGKNYLSAYVASTGGGSPNIGNGNFEFGATTGWSLAHSTLSGGYPSQVAGSGTPFSSSAGGSAANSHLTLSTVSSGQISGLYSGSLASSTISTAGDMLISNAFNIDVEDQAKVMTLQLYYNVNSGAANLNFSGSSSNSYAMLIYDVTNAAWIIPAGVYNLVQNSGTGYVVGTFQTTTNSTQYQIALVNVNASGGAYTLYLDDFVVGPQTAPSGPAMSDDVPFTGTISTGTGPVAPKAIFMSRRGDKLYVHGSFAVGTITGGTAYLTLPSGLNLDTTKLGTLGADAVGQWFSATATNGLAQYSFDGSTANLFQQLFFDGSTTNQIFLAKGAQNNAYSAVNWSTILHNFDSVGFYFEVPIAGWSSNTSMSSDTDTRVVSARYHASGAVSIGTGINIINYNTQDWDTHAAVTTGASWKFTAPVTGYYDVFAQFCNVTANTYVYSTYIYKNGSVFAENYTSRWVAGVGGICSPTASVVQLNAGDYISIYTYANGNSDNTTSSASDNYVTITRRSGPAVVAATESVSFLGRNSAGSATANTAISSGWTSVKDSHNAFSSGTYTVPVSGDYFVSFAAASTSGTPTVQIRKNGSLYLTGMTAGSSQTRSQASTLIPSLNGGDTITVSLDSSLTITTSTTDTLLSIFRLKN